MKKLVLFKIILLLCSVSWARPTQEIVESIPTYYSKYSLPQKIMNQESFLGAWCNLEDENDQLIVRIDKTFSYFENGNLITKNWYKQLPNFATSNADQSGIGFGYDSVSNNLFLADMRPAIDLQANKKVYQAHLRTIYSRCKDHLGF